MDDPKTRREQRKSDKDKKAKTYSAKHIRLVEARKKTTPVKKQ
jgi:hypothetical protein